MSAHTKDRGRQERKSKIASSHGHSLTICSITSFMIKQSLPAVSILTSETIEEFKTADKVVVVGYFDPTNKEANETYTAVAESLRDNFLFGATGDVALAKAEELTSPAVVVYKSFDEGKSVYSDKLDAEAITAFIKTSSIPLIGEVSAETYQGYMEAGIPLAYIFALTEAERTEFATALKPVAEKHRGVISFATIDAEAFGAHAGNLNLKPDQFPAFAIQETVKNTKFPFDQDLKITPETIGKFVDDFVAGKIQPSIKSEPVPETQEGPVHVIVANNYQDLVIDNDKDVLVEFYAPWCGHCKALAPKYEDLAGFYFNNPDYAAKVVIAKVDATANDVPDEIQGFPTIKLFPAGSKDSPITYTGSRTIEDLAKFIAENGSHKIEVVIPVEESIAEDDEGMAQQAAAATKKATEAAKDATEAVKEKVAEATEAVKEAVSDDHDEL